MSREVPLSIRGVLSILHPNATQPDGRGVLVGDDADEDLVMVETDEDVVVVFVVVVTAEEADLMEEMEDALVVDELEDVLVVNELEDGVVLNEMEDALVVDELEDALVVGVEELDVGLLVEELEDALLVEVTFEDVSEEASEERTVEVKVDSVDTEVVLESGAAVVNELVRDECAKLVVDVSDEAVLDVFGVLLVEEGMVVDRTVEVGLNDVVDITDLAANTLILYAPPQKVVPSPVHGTLQPLLAALNLAVFPHQHS